MLTTPSTPVRLATLALLLPAAVFAQGRFLVKVRGDIGPVAQRNQVTVLKALSGSASGMYVLSAPRGADARQLLRNLAADAAVQSAEPEKPVKLPGLASSVNPNPSGIPSASTRLDGTPVFYYNSFAAAAYVNQQAGAIVGLARAHALSDGSGIRVAVIDTGIDRFQPVLFTSIAEGYDFVNNRPGGQEVADINQETTPILDQETTPILDQETTPILDGGSAIILQQETTPILDQETTPILDSKIYPAFGHGTMVSGLVHLVAPRALLMPVRVFGANGAATISQIVDGIYWAVDHGAGVINMSFSTTQDSPALAAAIDYAARKGVICVAAAGNNGQAMPVWPAAYDSVIGVGSTDNFLTRSLFSNYGTPPVTLAAPGEGDVTVYPGNHYAQVWGTSFSAPLVAGGAALLLDLSGRVDSGDAAKALANAQYIGQQMGAGELNLYQACLAVKQKKYN
ncbi:MAG: S8 family serine peptidase [Acidobacteria bacterium]|nr:S8 family serine peptidase [Acidobacteriota bacterium]